MVCNPSFSLNTAHTPFYFLSQSLLLLRPLEASVPFSFPVLVPDRGKWCYHNWDHHPATCTSFKTCKALWKEEGIIVDVTSSWPSDSEKGKAIRHLINTHIILPTPYTVSGQTIKNTTKLKSALHRSFHSCADVFIGQSPRNEAARSKDKRISNSVNYFQIVLHKGYTTLHPRDVQKGLFSPSFATEHDVKRLNFW